LREAAKSLIIAKLFGWPTYGRVKPHGASGGDGGFGIKMMDRATAGANMTISLTDPCYGVSCQAFKNPVFLLKASFLCFCLSLCLSCR
jgi:hypothetical protein